MRRITSLTFMFILISSNCCYANDDMVEQCQKVTIAGTSQWPPYTIAQERTGNIAGVGMELASQIFAELDVPVERVTFDDKLKMLHALSTGEIDLIVSTYNYSELSDVADLLQPAYINDPISVAVDAKKVAELDSWESLSGQHGIMSYAFFVDDETNSFFSKYLNIDNTGSLLNMLQFVKHKKFDYAVGSYRQLTYAIRANNLQNVLAVAAKLSKSGDVFMAFSKTSVCHHYASFVSKRLQDYKNNGKVDKMIKQY